ncbi:ParB/RepB/Spo0J family partition protein [Brachybacterium tyrofermentans]|uniref:ParB/RepB/Spo0J family partition protein n=1 Tax=Brachybacterium tyrofermentans TaxID=47848 RepID=UPI003FCF700A
MTQKRGLGRGLGALIPGAGSSPAPEQELRTRAQRASAADQEPSSPRPVDMFFSGEKASEDQDYPQRERGARTDLAGEMARAAAQRRGRGASTRSTTTRGGAVAAEGPTETAEAPTPAKPTRTHSTSTAGASSSKSSTTKSSTAKSSSSKPAASKPTPAKKTPAEPKASKRASGTSTPSKAAAEKATATKTAPAKSALKKAAPAKAESAAPSSAAEQPTSAPNAPSESAPAPTAPSVADSLSTPTEETSTAATPTEPTTSASSTGDDIGSAHATSEDVVADNTAAEVAAEQPAPARAEEPQQEEADDPALATAGTASAEDPAEDVPADEDHGAEAPSDEARSDAESSDVHGRQELVSVPGAEFAEIPIHEIRENPRNPRTMFDDDELDELAFSLREVGVLQPVVVRPIPVTDEGESFELVMGERRWRAARRAELTAIPAIIRETSDDDLLRDALLENLHRAQLNPLEEANAYQQLLEDFGCTQDELGERIGRSRPQITNTLRLLRLPALVQRRLASGALSAGHARTLLSLDDPALMEELAQRIVSEGLSVRAVERLVARGGQQAPARTIRRTTYNPHVVDLTSRLSNRLETPVRIDVGKRKGKITLEFTNLEDLDRLIDSMGLAVPASGTDEDMAD